MVIMIFLILKIFFLSGNDRNYYNRLYYVKHEDEIKASRKNQYIDAVKLKKKRKCYRICNMNEESVKHKQQEDGIITTKENITESKREKDKVANKKEIRIQSKKETDRVMNMSEGRMENKRQKDRITNLSE